MRKERHTALLDILNVTRGGIYKTYCDFNNKNKYYFKIIPKTRKVYSTTGYIS